MADDRPISDSASDLGYSFGRLLLFAAQELGCSAQDDNGDPVLPEQRRQVWQCMEAVKDGLRMLVTAYEWPWLVRTFSVTVTPTLNPAVHVGGKVTRYRMPWWFGSALGIAYAPDSIRCEVSIRSYLELQRLEAETTGGSNPIVAAFYPIEPSAPGEESPGFGMAVWPAPSSDQELIVSARAWPVCPSGDDDRFIAGDEYADVVKRAVVLAAARERGEEERIQRRTREYEQSLTGALERAKRTRPGVLGRLERNSDVGVGPWSRRVREHQYMGQTLTS